MMPFRVLAIWVRVAVVAVPAARANRSSSGDRVLFAAVGWREYSRSVHVMSV
jgi:hypothetical protein